MSEYFDRYETRPLKARETAFFRDLRSVLKISRARAPALRGQLKGVDIDAIKSRADLAKIPVVRKSDLKAMQADNPPFGGLAAVRAMQLKRILVSPGPIFEPEGFGKDWWGAARALHAAGLRKGDLLLNAFSYHLTPGGHIMESGAHALSCTVIPAGVGNTEQQLEAIHHLKPTAYCGTPDFLKLLLDKARAAGIDATSIKRALVSGAALPASLRVELEKAGVAVRECYASADLGVVAYESDARDGMIVNEGSLLEIVKPGTGDPVKEGEVGEVVVTRLNSDYPLLRFATGDLSAVLPGKSPCGRTNMRIRGWLGRADQTTKVKGMFVRPEQIADVARRHPELGRVRLVVTRDRESDAMTLKAECTTQDKSLAARIADTLAAVTKLKGGVDLVAPGSLPNDGKVIADERTVG